MGWLKVPSTSILSQSREVLGDGEATKRNVTGRPDWRRQQVRLRCLDSQPYCLLNKLKGEQMEGCSHGFCTAAWTQSIKTHSDPRF